MATNALMRWSFDTPDVGNLIAPIQQGMKDMRAAEQQNVENERQNKLMSFRQQEVDQSKARFDREGETAKAHLFGKAMTALASQPPEVIAQYAPQIIAKHPEYAAKFAEHGIPMDNPHVAVKMLAQQYGDYDPLAIEKNRAQIEASKASTASSYASTAATNAQAQQLSRQTPEYRRTVAKDYGLTEGTPEYNQFVISGQYAPKSSRVTLNEGQTIGDVVPDGNGGSTFKPIVQGADKPPPEHIAKAANFASRMVEAERNVRSILNGKDPISGKEGGTPFPAADNDIALTNALPEAARNMVISGDHQRYRQAAEQWIRAFLRKESGAAIGADEFKRDFVVYFPQPGDKPEVIAQKEAARVAAAGGIAGEGGKFFRSQDPNAASNLERFRGSPSPITPERKQPVFDPREIIQGVQQKIKAGEIDPRALIEEAQQAIAAGKPREAIAQRLQQLGINPAVLGQSPQQSSQPALR